LGRTAIGDRVLDASVSFLEERVSRRSLLARSAFAGSALAVAPLRFLLRPVSAAEVLARCHGNDCNHPPPPPQKTVRCRDCSHSSTCCSSGYTAFCCTVNPDGGNTCPPHTEPGGWWKCTNYRGSRLCSDRNIRYYIDCNVRPGHKCEGGCHCAADDCGQRHTCCVVFKYGQCHVGTHATAIACRVVKCRRPCEIYRGECNCGPLQVDDNTCSHEAACL